MHACNVPYFLLLARSCLFACVCVWSTLLGQNAHTHIHIHLLLLCSRAKAAVDDEPLPIQHHAKVDPPTTSPLPTLHDFSLLS
ncbi:hypothetical protein BC567DRAFT_233056 [Phyllosticta citribraziliensis]